MGEAVIKGLESRQMLGWGAQHDPQCLVGRLHDAGDSIQLLPLSPGAQQGKAWLYEAGRVR